MRATIESGTRRAVAAVALSALTVALTAGPPAVAAPPAGTQGPSGAATAENTLAALSYGSSTMKVGVDRAVSTWGAARSASATMDFLATGAATLGGGSRMATKESESGSEALGTGNTVIEGLASATITGASLEATLEAARAYSSSNVTIADLSLISGLVTAATAQTSTSSTVTPAEAAVDRTLRLGNVDVLSIRALLAQLGVAPVALACSAVEAAGAELGVATGQACETLAAAHAAAGDAQTALDGHKTILDADLQTAQATVAGLTLVTQPLIDLAAAYGIDLSSLLGLVLPGAGRDDLIAEIDRRLTAVDSGIGDAAAGTCEATQSALTGVTTAVGSLGAVLTPLGTAIGDACDTLRGILGDLLDTSLLGLDGVRVGLSAIATPGNPFADGSGSIGAITVGNRSITVAGVSSTGAALQSAIKAAKTEAGDALAALGVGAFPDPDIRILSVSESAGQDANGSWYARVSVTGLHVGIPAVPIALPSGPTLGDVLDASSGASAASRAAAAAAPVTTSPAISLDAAVFTGSAFYNRSTSIGPDGNPLPETGVGVPRAAAIALVLAAAAGARLLARSRERRPPIRTAARIQ